MFTARERRAILLLIPLLAASVWLLSEAFKPRFDDTALLLGDTVTARRGGDSSAAEEVSETSLFPFDPNRITYEELRSLGIDKRTAAGIIKYRTAGKIFAVAEDFATCYGITDSIYSLLKPYIIIGEEYRIRPTGKALSPEGSVSSAREAERREGSREQPAHSKTLVPFDPNALDQGGFEALGFTAGQARAIINFREACGGFRKAEDFGKSYVVSPEAYSRLKDYIVIPPTEARSDDDTDRSHSALSPDDTQANPAPLQRLELNGADSLSLLQVRGIGPRTASAVLRYRQRLGGYHAPSQIIETGVVTERNWELMKEQIWADSCAIRKIDINFATPNAIAEHPYISPRTMRRIMRNRQLKGGWSTIEDMIEDNTLTKEEASKLAPYLHFGTAPIR